ncbi:MAG: DUF4864 domain-containing protein [Bacteroidota bacterium]
MPAASAFLIVLLLPVLVIASRPSDPEPSPDLSPVEVIRIQVEALQNNDEPRPNAGIALAFSFASPENRAATGPLPRFTAMVRGPVYGDMLGFDRAEYSAPVVEGSRAAQLVTLYHNDGREATYVFQLSRQEGGRYDGCWMTDGVMRRDPAQSTTRV